MANRRFISFARPFLNSSKGLSYHFFPGFSTRALRMASSSPSSISYTESITEKINTALKPVRFELFNDSHKHSHHAAMRGSSNAVESHFRLEIVSEEFAGKSQPARHRIVYKLLEEELAANNGVHALQLKTRTPDEDAKLSA